MNWRRIILTSLVCFSFSTVGAQRLSQEYINLCNEFFNDEFFKYVHVGKGCEKIDCTTGYISDTWFEKTTYYKFDCRDKTDSIVF